ncbi:unnamed protein product [Prunus armeniaca]
MSSAIEDEMAVFVKKLRRILKNNGKFAREDGQSNDKKFRPFDEMSSERRREGKSISKKSSNSVKCYTCGGIGHYDVD